jgi:hypothetical protein
MPFPDEGIGMKRRSPAQWREVFQAQQASGLSATVFCRGHQVCPKYFSLRQRQLMGDAILATVVSPFVPVAVQRTAEAMALEVRLDDTLQLRVPPSVSSQWLAALLHALRN